MATIEQKVRAILLLREREAAIKDAVKRRLAIIAADMETITDSLRKDLLNQQEQTGATTIPASCGTVFFTKREKFNVTDREVVDAAVKAGELPLSIFTNAVSKDELKAIIAAEHEKLSAEGVDESALTVEKLLPPGIGYHEYDEVSVRKKPGADLR